MKLQTAGFHHVTMVSTDAVRTLRFYGGLLGLDLVKRTVNFDDPGAYHLYFGYEGGRPGTIVTFFEWPRSRRGHWGVGGVHHLALAVDDLDGLLRWKRRLVDAGVQVSGPIDRGYFTSLYFSDPDGQVLEIATRGPGYAVDEPADRLGEAVVEAPLDRKAGETGRVDPDATHPEPVPEVTDPMRLRGIHHVTGITDDIERAHDFYTGALGLRVVKKTFNQDDTGTPHWFWARYDGEEVADHSAFTLFGWKGSDYLARPGAGQTHHVAFRAADDEEQEAWRAHLLEMGLEVTPVQDRSYFRSIYFRAPDGLLVEIATDTPGFTVDEAPSELGERLQLPPWLEPRRERIEAALTPLG